MQSTRIRHATPTRPCTPRTRPPARPPCAGLSGLSGVSVYARLDDDLQAMIFGRVIVQLRPSAMKVGQKN